MGFYGHCLMAIKLKETRRRGEKRKEVIREEELKKEKETRRLGFHYRRRGD